MKVVTSFPHQVRQIENCWIPMSDGCRLAARIWLPADAYRSPVPAIIEYIPYRKRDATRQRDESMHHYFAGHGYAAVRIDLRGSGESDGLLLDEYLKQEQDDGVEAIAWITAQTWCSGAVGMMGKSWGGFNSLQVAARRPPQLKAIITVCSTDDRYADDAHFMGGCLLNENLIWGSTLMTINAQPPDPQLVGDRWRAMWLERLEHSPLFPEIWLKHQRRDDYWKHGSVCEDFDQITCPVYAVGGWADGYTNAVPRLLAGLKSPRKGLVGPWAHVYPHEGVPQPAIGFLQEALRWWDYWLKGIATGIMDEPMYRVWMQSSVPPQSFYDRRPGRWVAETVWPSDRIQNRRYALCALGLTDAGNADDADQRLPHSAASESLTSMDATLAAEERFEFRSPQSVGLAAGSWCGFGLQGEMPLDQREDDGKSLTFDTAPRDEPLEILGAPLAVLTLSADRPYAFVAVRLNDVAPDGASTRVTYALLNLTHRGGHEHPEPLVPGQRYRVQVQLNHIAHTFPAGHRVRLAISTSYWPVAWPSPEPVLLTVIGRESFFELPIRPPHAIDQQLRPFQAPAGAPPLEAIDIHAGGVQRTIHYDVASDEFVYRTMLDLDDQGGPAMTRVEPIALEIGHATIEQFRIKPQEPLSASAEIVQKTICRRENWATRVETQTLLSATKEAFHLQANLQAFENDGLVFSKTWDQQIARDML